MAKKIMKEMDGIVEEAPSAIPSAAACMMSPSVVENEAREVGRDDGVVGPEEERSESEYIFIRWGGGGGFTLGRVSIRYISMNPKIRETPIQACGSLWRFSELAGACSPPNAWMTPGSVGVLGGFAISPDMSKSIAWGITAPGSASTALPTSARIWSSGRAQASCIHRTSKAGL